MKKVPLIIIVLSYLSMSGCDASREIRAKSISERIDVFYEVNGGESPLSGFCNLEVVLQFKTTPPRFYPLESKKPVVSPIILNIDGQSVIWDVSGKRDDTPLYDRNGHLTIEGGSGVRYYLHKKLTLHCGQHNVFIALRSPTIYKEVNVVLQEDNLSILEFQPIYNDAKWRGQQDMRGLDRFDIEFKSIKE